MVFHSLLPRPDIGANSYLFDLDGTRVVIDSGLHPKRVGAEALPLALPPGVGALDGIILTHAHLDHVGTLPLLQRRHPRTPVFLSEATAAIAQAMLHNSVNVMSSQREELGLPEYPLFTHGDVDACGDQWAMRRLERPFEIGGGSVRARFHHAGHVLGAVGVTLETPRGSILHTGDVHFEEQSIETGADFPQGGIDVLVMEATRGAAPRRSGYSRAAEASRLAALIRETLDGGGSVLMPVFALGKSQEVIVLLHELARAGEIPPAPVFLGGLSLKITRIYDEFSERVRRRHPGLELLREIPQLQVPPRPRRGAARPTPPQRPGAIFALSSGMMTENTLSNDFAFGFLGNPKNTVAFVGYADPESPGGRLKSAAPGARVALHSQRAAVEVKARVESFDFSGHADREALRAYANRLKPGKIILVHGDPPALEWFQQTLQADLPATRVQIARAEEPIPLA
jgi:Cft2 family RNA processing exonuclease